MSDRGAIRWPTEHRPEVSRLHAVNELQMDAVQRIAIGIPESVPVGRYAKRVLEAAQRMLSWRLAHDEQTLTHFSLTPNGVYERRGPRWE